MEGLDYQSTTLRILHHTEGWLGLGLGCGTINSWEALKMVMRYKLVVAL